MFINFKYFLNFCHCRTSVYVKTFLPVSTFNHTSFCMCGILQISSSTAAHVSSLRTLSSLKYPCTTQRNKSYKGFIFVAGIELNRFSGQFLQLNYFLPLHVAGIYSENICAFNESLKARSH